MGNTIQQASNLGVSRYGREFQLGLDSQHETQLSGGNLSVSTSEQEQAYTVEISDQARKMYASTTETAYTKSFSEISGKFADFHGRISSGDYERSDVTVNDLKLDTIDEMEQKYQEYKNQITSSSLEENQNQLAELDKAYNSAFEKNILDSLKKIYNEKMGLATPGTSKKELVQTDDSKTSIYDFISLTSNGLYYIDLSTISNVDELLNKELKMITGYRYGNEEDHVTN